MAILVLTVAPAAMAQINTRYLRKGVSPDIAQRLYSKLVASSQKKRPPSKEDRKLQKASELTAKNPGIQRIVDTPEGRKYADQIAELFKVDLDAKARRQSLEQVDSLHKDLVAAGRAYLNGIPSLPLSFAGMFSLNTADWVVTTVTPEQSGPPPASNVIELSAPYAVGFNSNDSFFGGPGTQHHHENLDSGKVSASSSCWSGLVILEPTSLVGQYVTVPDGYTKMNIGFFADINHYELSVDSGAGFSAARVDWTMTIQRAEQAMSTVESGSLVELAALNFHNSSQSGRWNGWIPTGRDIDVTPGETILVCGGIGAESSVLQVGGGASSNVRGTVQKIVVNFSH